MNWTITNPDRRELWDAGGICVGYVRRSDGQQIWHAHSLWSRPDAFFASVKDAMKFVEMVALEAAEIYARARSSQP